MDGIKSPEPTVDNYLSVSGIKTALDQLPPKIAGELFGSLPAGTPEVAREALVQSYDDAYPNGAITEGAAKALKSGNDGSRLNRLIKVVSSPLALKMTALELKEPTPEEAKNFTATLASKPPGPQRVALLKELLDETRSVEAYARIAEVTTESLLVATSSGCADDVKRIREGAAQRRAMIRQAVSSSAMLGLLYAYRSVTDDELREYLATYKEPDARAVNATISKVIVSEYLSRWREFEKTLVRLGGDLSGRSMFAKTCLAETPAAAAPEGLEQARLVASPSPYSDSDARRCLELNDSKKIAACAERFR